ncbi:hypothetical protein [Curtobacterium flaccumfaciens]|uniref:hypothetical protein n=1 Tax=Curtobacterium flaccumfaciens TaxID=2035 RepID=UPI003CFA7EC2
MKQQDLERIVEAIGHRDWWDYAVGATTAAAAIASVVIAFVAVHIARNAEAGRKSAERELRQDRDEARLRDAIRTLIESLHDQVRRINAWAVRPIEGGLGEGSPNGEFEEEALRLDPPLDRGVVELHESAQRPRYEALRGALDNVLLAGTTRSHAALQELQTLVFDVIVAPQWYAAAQHLTDISSALARWSGRDEDVDAFVATLQEIRLQHQDQFRVAEALRGT